MSKAMSPSEQCKQAGLKSLAELSKISGTPVSTLNDWHRTKPFVFKSLVFYAANLKKESFSLNARSGSNARDDTPK